MKAYAQIINEQTKECNVGTGTNTSYYESLGMTLQDVEQDFRGVWYLAGYAPAAPEPTYQEQRAAAYPEIGEQLDMIYWDKVNNTDNWQRTIAEIKAKYPKEAAENAKSTDINNPDILTV